MKEEVLTILFEIQVRFLMTLSVHVSEFLNLGRLNCITCLITVPPMVSCGTFRSGRMHKLGLCLFSITLWLIGHSDGKFLFFCEKFLVLLTY